MIEALFGAPTALAAFGISLLIFGFAPGMVLALIVKLIPDEDRRRELQAELYEVPRWERPYWVAQQFEVALRLGAFPRIEWYWGKYVWHRAKVESGVERNREHPETFCVPDDGRGDPVPTRLGTTSCGWMGQRNRRNLRSAAERVLSFHRGPCPFLSPTLVAGRPAKRVSRVD